jgi:hypothetical protein
VDLLRSGFSQYCFPGISSTFKSVVSLAATVFLPSIYERGWPMRTTYMSHNMPVTLSSHRNIFGPLTIDDHVKLALSSLVLTFSTIGRPFLLRKPKTVSWNITYLCRSEILLKEDVGTSTKRRQELSEHIQRSKKYARLTPSTVAVARSLESSGGSGHITTINLPQLETRHPRFFKSRHQGSS